jgi:hypothetical protein
MTYGPILIFASVFCVVFCLGLQSQLVNNGHAVLAAMNSLAIGAANIVLYKLAPNATGPEIAAYILGGPAAIVCSMFAYRWYRGRQRALRNQRKKLAALNAAHFKPLAPIPTNRAQHTAKDHV